MKLPHVFRRRKLLLICLIASMVFSLAKVSVPVSSSPSPGTKVYVEMPPEGYVNGTEIGVGNIFEVDVYVENATDLVQWALYVQVDPAVLEVMGAKDGAGTVIRDYVTSIGWTPSDVWAVGLVNKTEGKINDITHVINAWDELKNASAGNPGWGFNGSGKLCTLGFRVLNETAYSPIHLYNVELFDGLYWYVPELHPFPPDIVEDGHYNPPVHDVAITDITGPALVIPGDIANISVSVANEGGFHEDFNVTVFYDSEPIGIKPISLGAGLSTTEIFEWDTTNVNPMVYNVTAVASTVDGEINTDNNTEIMEGGINVYPEFPTLAPLLLALAILAASTIVLKRKPLTKPSTSGSPTTQP